MSGYLLNFDHHLLDQVLILVLQSFNFQFKVINILQQIQRKQKLKSKDFLLLFTLDHLTQHFQLVKCALKLHICYIYQWAMSLHMQNIIIRGLTVTRKINHYQLHRQSCEIYSKTEKLQSSFGKEGAIKQTRYFCR